jgi:hypothetical protein
MLEGMKANEKPTPSKGHAKVKGVTLPETKTAKV